MKKIVIALAVAGTTLFAAMPASAEYYYHHWHHCHEVWHHHHWERWCRW